MSDFAQVWDGAAIGDRFEVSNGQIRPDGDETTMAYKVWRSHNFTGALVEKIDGAPRGMRLDLAPDAGGNVIGYTIREGGGHSFEVPE